MSDGLALPAIIVPIVADCLKKELKIKKEGTSRVTTLPQEKKGSHLKKSW